MATAKQPAAKATKPAASPARKPATKAAAPAKPAPAKSAPAKPPRAVKAAAPAVEPVDAATLLKADHKKVDGLFEAFDAARGSGDKAKIVAEICTELKVHTMIEEEVFYPALRGKIDDSVIDEAYVEHDGAKVLVNDLATGSPADAMYDAKVKVLAEEIRHHVKEEERWLTGMFAKARMAGVDMTDLGTKMAARKAELLAAAATAPLQVAKPTAIKLVTA